MQGIFVVDVFLGIRGAPREDEHAKEAAEQTTSQGRTVHSSQSEQPARTRVPFTAGSVENHSAGALLQGLKKYGDDNDDMPIYPIEHREPWSRG